MGRAPCCDKANVKKGPWSPEEDATLKSYIEENGTGGNWIALPQKIGLKRCGKSCRLRWLNYLRPNLKHGGFSEEEDRIICSLYVSIGSRWSIIAAQLPGRTDNDIKNYWNTRLKKKLLGKQGKDHGHSSMGRKSKRSSVLLDGNYINHPPVGLPNSTFSSIPTNNQVMIPYWPTPEPYLHPIPTTNIASATTTTTITSGFNDQSSVRSLLMKLGGRVHTNGCDQTAYYDHHNQQEGLMDLHPPFPSTDDPQVSNQLMNILATDGDIEGQLMRSEYNLEGCLSQSILQSSIGNATTIVTATTAAFPAELEELMASHPDNSQRINSLDFMAWEGMMINNNATRSETSTCGERQGSWGEMSPFVSLPMGSSACDQGMIPIPAGAFDEMRYIGGQ